MRNIDNTPASVMTIAMTIASRGRSTKTDESIDQVLPGAGWFAGVEASLAFSSGLLAARDSTAAGPAETG
jgi:hypothetical protein